MGFIVANNIKEELGMIQIISGEMGKGKTKELLKMVNQSVHSTSGNIVYLDKNNKHMYELSNKVRLINVMEFGTENSDEFIGFVRGIISQDRDLEKIYVDSFLKVACVSTQTFETILNKLTLISEKFHVDFVLCISLEKNQIPLTFQDEIMMSL